MAKYIYVFINSDLGPFFYHKLNDVEHQRDKGFKKCEIVKFKIIKKPNLTAENSADRNGNFIEVELV